MLLCFCHFAAGLFQSRGNKEPGKHVGSISINLNQTVLGCLPFLVTTLSVHVLYPSNTCARTRRSKTASATVLRDHSLVGCACSEG